MNLATGQGYARQIAKWLSPFCERLEVAGSIRRERPEVGDVDIVCIPKTVEHRDMLEVVTAVDNVLYQFLSDYIKDRNPLNSPGRTPRWLSGGVAAGKQAVLELPKCQLDLWFADEKTFATRLLCRTGSKEHNIWLCDRANERGYHWDTYVGLIPQGQTGPVPLDSEAAIYNHLGLEFIEPRNREAGWIRKNLEFGLKV
jgi:DNA polymerase (family 10)